MSTAKVTPGQPNPGVEPGDRWRPPRARPATLGPRDRIVSLASLPADGLDRPVRAVLGVLGAVAVAARIVNRAGATLPAVPVVGGRG